MTNYSCEVRRNDLDKKLQRLKLAVAKRSRIPALSCILVSRCGSDLILAATNLEMYAVATIDVVRSENDTDFSFLLPAKDFADLVHRAKSEYVKFDVVIGQHDKGETIINPVVIHTDKIEHRLQAIESAEFPYAPLSDNYLPVTPEKWLFSCSIDFLNRMNEKVLFAAADDDARPVLENVCIKQEKNEAIAVATDGFRLSRFVLALGPDDLAKDFDQCFIPATALKLLPQMLGKKNDRVLVWKYSAGRTYFSSADMQVCVIERSGYFGERENNPTLRYPDYHRVIPTSFDLSVVIDRDEWLQNIKQIKKSLVLVLHFVQDGLVQLTSDEIQMNLTAQYTDQEAKIAFNPRYLTEALQSFDTPKIILEFARSLVGKHEYQTCYMTSKGYNHLLMLMSVRKTGNT